MPTCHRSFLSCLLLLLAPAAFAAMTGPAPRSAASTSPVRRQGPYWQALIALRPRTNQATLHLIPARPAPEAGEPRPAACKGPAFRF